MELVVTDSHGKDLSIITDYSLDIAYGKDENDYELVLPAYSDTPELEPSARFYADGKDLGGIVDGVQYDWSRFGKVIKYSGRTWQGILSHKIIEPPTGQSHYTVKGEANQVLNQIINKLGLSDYYKASDEVSNVTINYQFPRYIDAYNGILRMCRVHDLVLDMKCLNGRVELGVKPREVHDLYSEQRDFSLYRSDNVVNHLVCLGQGELTERTVVHLYADSQGNISQSQSITGLDEVSEVYEDTNSTRDELIERGTEHLAEMQTFGSVDLTVTDGDVNYDIGTIVTASDGAITITGEVAKKVTKVERGIASFEYQIDNIIAYKKPLNL